MQVNTASNENRYGSKSMDMQVPTPDDPVRVECPLWQLGKERRATIVGFDERMPEAYRGRLAEMGFHFGEVVTCLLRPAFGSPRVYRVSNTVYSLDADIAGRIRVVAHD